VDQVDPLMLRSLCPDRTENDFYYYCYFVAVVADVVVVGVRTMSGPSCLNSSSCGSDSSSFCSSLSSIIISLYHS